MYACIQDYSIQSVTHSTLTHTTAHRETDEEGFNELIISLYSSIIVIIITCLKIHWEREGGGS